MMMLWIIPLFVSVAILALFVGIYRLTGAEAKIESRLESVPVLRIPNADKPSRSHAIAGFVGGQLARSRTVERIARDLAQANVKLTVNEYLTLTVGIILAAFVVGVLLTRMLIPGIALAIVAVFVPRLYLQRLQSQRLKAFQDQLPDVLSLLVSSLKAGYGLLHAMEMVVQEMPVPSSEEFGKVTREVALGFSLPEALNHLVRRVNSDDLELVVTAISVQHEVGGNLAQILETISETIRERVRIKGEISVMTTQQRMTGFVLSGMPFLLGTIIMVINPDYMMTMFQPRWLIIPGAAVGMMVVGNLVIRRILNQEF
jgi:tight adherence protein B